MDGDWTDDEEEASPLDDIDPFLAFSDALKQLQVPPKLLPNCVLPHEAIKLQKLTIIHPWDA